MEAVSHEGRDYCHNTFDPLGYIATLMIGFQLMMNIVNVNNNDKKKRSYPFEYKSQDVYKKHIFQKENRNLIKNVSLFQNPPCYCDSKPNNSLSRQRQQILEIMKTLRYPNCSWAIGCNLIIHIYKKFLQKISSDTPHERWVMQVGHYFENLLKKSCSKNNFSGCPQTEG